VRAGTSTVSAIKDPSICRRLKSLEEYCGKVDRSTSVIFLATFALFNVIYWGAYTNGVGSKDWP